MPATRASGAKSRISSLKYLSFLSALLLVLRLNYPVLGGAHSLSERPATMGKVQAGTTVRECLCLAILGSFLHPDPEKFASAFHYF
jgi:hypothetical protein